MKAWPIQGTSGVLYVVKGTVLVCLINPAGIKDENDGLHAELDSRVAKDAMNLDGLVIAKVGDAVYVPFAWSCLTYGLTSSRATIAEASQINEAKKASTGKKKAAKAEQGREFCKMMWLPCWSPGRDAKQDPKVVGRQYATMAASQKYLTAGVVSDAAWKDLMESLKRASETVSKDTLNKKDKALLKRNSSAS